MAFIEAEQLIHEYKRRDDQGQVVDVIRGLDGVDLSVEKGAFVCILGRNGSGKSTFAKHLNVLLRAGGGHLTVNGMDAAKEENLLPIRRTAGMIFQNPDNQLVAGVVEEDVAFGPENIGVPTEELEDRVSRALETVGMEEYRYHSPNRLSGGQKQRIAIAGVLAMEPECIIFDESTAMLDPAGRAEILEEARTLNRERGITVIWITHYMEEVIRADLVYVMDRGKVLMQGTPREIFTRAEELTELGLDVPAVTRLGRELRQAGLDLPEAVLDRQELAEALIALRK